MPLNPNLSKHDMFQPVAGSPSSFPGTFSPSVSASFGSSTGTLGDEQGNLTLSSTVLETMRPHFRLLHASCSHFLFCPVILLPPPPASQLAFSSSPLSLPFCSLLSPSLCTEIQGSALAGGLSCYNPCCSPFISPSFPPSPPASRFLSSSSFTESHAFLFLCSRLSLCGTYSSAPFISHPPPSAHPFQILYSTHAVNI